MRRGQELSLWGALGAGNYNYVMEWIFRDDGVIIGRAGATAVNLPSEPLTPHTHNPIWRLDVDLDEASGDSVSIAHHTETGALGNDSHIPVTVERGVEWQPNAFTGLHVTDATLKNGKGNQSGYMPMPMLMHGTSRNQEAFTRFDMWVTRYRWTEMEARNLPNYMSPPENVQNTDIVLWYKGSMHHHPRDEDGEFIGQTWSGEACNVDWIHVDAGQPIRSHTAADAFVLTVAPLNPIGNGESHLKSPYTDIAISLLDTCVRRVLLRPVELNRRPVGPVASSKSMAAPARQSDSFGNRS